METHGGGDDVESRAAEDIREKVGAGDGDDVMDDSSADDGMDDSDFTSEDEEYIDARRNKRTNNENYVAGLEIMAMHNMEDGTKTSEVNGAESGYETEYADSDGSMETVVSSDEGDFDIQKTKRVRRNVYVKNTDPKKLELDIGLIFEDGEECKSVVQTWAVVNGYNIKWTRGGNKKLEAKCESGCPWRFYASRIAHEQSFVIKTYESSHTCVRSTYNRQATSEWLAKQFLEKIRRYHTFSAKNMQEEVLLTYDINVSMAQCYAARSKALNKIRGSLQEHYNKLRPYVAELMKMDREGRFELKTEIDENNHPVFKRIFIGFSALRKGFLKGCRKVIGFDACFLKTALGGALLGAVSKDANNKMYPIAWAVVERENEETWTWFFKILFEELDIFDGFGWTFTSDQQKGLINAIKKLSPQAEHRNCARHIYANWKKNFAGPKFKRMFWEIAKSTSENQFHSKLKELKDESVSAYEALCQKNPRVFCRALISTLTKSNSIENNICETFNGYKCERD